MWNDPAIATADLKLIQLGQYIHICERNGKEMFDQCIEWDKMNMLKKIIGFGNLQVSVLNEFIEYVNDQFTFNNEIKTL